MVRRERTNTPLQALVLLNEEQFFAAAKGLATRMLALTTEQEKGVDDGDDFDLERLSLGFRMAISRKPGSEELSKLQANLKRLRDYYGQHPREAQTIAGDVVEKSERAAWVMTASVLLNLGETITKE